jgi:acetylornithine deacetylase/succinyl-diaminopimelate desuccinylase-like protein
MNTAIDPILAHLDAHRGPALERLFQLMRIPSISADPTHYGDCDHAAELLTADLNGMGFQAAVRKTPGRPMVVGHYRSKRPGAKHVLIYGHYDVQPCDPLDLWSHPPFEPRLAEDAKHGPIIVGRGASDDKGQLMTFMEAFRATLAVTGDLPVSVTVFLEGEEESGSQSLAPFLTEHAKELTADFAMVCDTGQWDGSTPAITTMLRGLAFTELTIKGPSRDLHSGMYGGAAINPIRALTHVLAGLHDATGRVQIDGFYDGVQEISPAQREQWAGLGFDEAKFLGEIGLTTKAGEAGRSALELVWARPTAEVNGIWGGYTGPGAKTVIPAEAAAKLTFRLVGDQDPDAIIENFKAFVASRLPADCVAQFVGDRGSRAISVNTESAPVKAAAAALTAEWGKPAVLMGAGGSIPVVQSFKSLLGMDTVLVGFALDDDRIHSPNEKYNLMSFERGARSWVRILAAL